MNIRLCKWIYKESKEIAFQIKEEINNKDDFIRQFLRQERLTIESLDVRGARIKLTVLELSG